MELKGKVPLEKWLGALEKVMLKHHDWKDTTLAEQNVEEMASLGTRTKGPFSFACAYVDRILTVQEFIGNMITGAEVILKEKVQEWELS